MNHEYKRLPPKTRVSHRVFLSLTKNKLERSTKFFPKNYPSSSLSMSSIGKRFVGGELVPRGYRAVSTRPSKVKRVKKGKIGLRGLLLKDKPELKEFQYVSGLNNVVQSGNLYIVNQVPQGTNFNQRIGNHIKAKYLRINWIAWAPQSTYPFDDLRMVVVWDVQPNGTAGAQIYNALANSANTILDNTAAPVVAFKNSGLAGDRFIILKDERMTAQSTAAAVTSAQNNQFDIRRFGDCYIDLRGQDMEYNTTTGGIPTTGALYVCWLSANNYGTSSQNGQFTFNTKLVFTDV